MTAIRVGFGLALLLANAVATACEHPPLIALPDKEDIGDSAGAIILEMRRYADAMVEFVACVQAELVAAGGDDAPDIAKAVLLLRNNAAVQEAKIVADLFVERVGPIENLRLAEFVESDREDCVRLDRIDRTAVLDDRAVLFLERDGDAYLNILENACPHLDTTRAFTYQLQAHRVNGLREVDISPKTPIIQRLCQTDFIYTYGPSAEKNIGSPCALGWFYALAKHQAATLMDGSAASASIVVARGAAGSNAESE
jgi:hypothetical protein